MSKKVCICGKDATKNKPLVITITTCKNKHPDPAPNNSKVYPPDQPSSPGPNSKNQSRPNSAKDVSRRSLSDTMNDSGNTTFFDAAETSTPIKNNKMNSSKSALKKHPSNGMNRRRLNFNNQDSIQSSEAEEGEDSEKPAIRLRNMEKNNTNATRVTYPFTDIDSSQSELPKNMAKESIGNRYRSIVVQAVGQTKDKVFNFPSDVALKLPVLPCRYHGPGCAMEINIMEKHAEHCKYKKLKNPMRNPVDDRVGSYEAIGRMMYNTCQIGHFNMSDLAEKNSSSIGKIFSLLSIPKKETYVLHTSISGKEVESLNDILNGFVQNSQSSIANLNNKSSVSDEDKNNDLNRKNYWLNSKKCDVEEIFFSGRKHDRSIPESEKQRKKWYTFLFPCIYVVR